MIDVCRLADPEWMLDKKEPFLQRRDRLPEPAESPKSISAWELIKEFVGRDLAKVPERLWHALYALLARVGLMSYWQIKADFFLPQ